MRHVLYHHRDKPDHPIRDLGSLVSKDLVKGSTKGVIAQAQALLLQELGLELKKIELITRGSSMTLPYVHVMWLHAAYGCLQA